MATGSCDDRTVLELLRAGDEGVFSTLVAEHTPALLRVVRGYVPDLQTAEDVVQETWIALIKGIAGFEGRSSLRTWLFTVAINTAKKRAMKDHRRDSRIATRPALATVDADCFFPSDDPEWPGHWRDSAEPRPFPQSPENSFLAKEMTAVAESALAELPDRQQAVVTLRDMLGFDAAEVCQILGLSSANQRVLLHRGRAVVRQALESYLEEA